MTETTEIYTHYILYFFFFDDTATTEIYTLSLHDALPISGMKAFTAAVLGGIGSLPGAMLGGLLIGLIEVFWSAYFTLEYKDVAAFSILVLVLIFRPSGLLGKPEIEKV